MVAALPGRVGDGPLVGRVVRLLLDRGFADPWWPDPAAADADVDDVTVVVPVQDRPAALDRLLGSLPSVVPVVVVDDGSADPDAVAAVADRHGARLVVHRRNLGPAAARNTGLRHVETEFAAFCDSDVVPEPGWLGVLRRHLDDPALAVVAPRILGSVPRDGRRLAGALRAGALLARPRRPPRGGPRATERCRTSPARACWPASTRSATASTSGCASARTSTWSGGCSAPGGACATSPPRPCGTSTARTSASGFAARRSTAPSAAALAARHADAVSPMVVTPWTAVVSAALLAQRRWSLPVAAGALAAATVATASRLGRSDRPVRVAAALTLEGAVAAGWQTGAALTRHYWPLAAVACLGSATRPARGAGGRGRGRPGRPPAHGAAARPGPLRRRPAPRRPRLRRRCVVGRPACPVTARAPSAAPGVPVPASERPPVYSRITRC